MEKIICEHCHNIFWVKGWSVRNGWGRFCSRQCHYLEARKGKTVLCDVCKEKIYRNPVKIKLSKSGKFFCSKSCQTVWRNREFSGARHKLWKDGSSTYRDVLIKADIKQICNVCRMNDRRVIVAHHKDQNRKNYDLDNLMWLCHNCHCRIHNGKTPA